MSEVTTSAAESRRSNTPLATAGLMLGALLSVLDQTVVAIALPSIAADVGGMESIGWTITAYLLATTITGALYGRLSDIVGRRTVFLSAVTLFILASVLAGLAQTLPQLVAARALQGIGGGALFVIPTIAIAELYPVAERGRMQGLMGAVFAVASVGGPLVGGTITDVAGWRWIFYINVPLGLFSIVLVALSLRLPRTGGNNRLDLPGSGLLATAVVSLLLVAEWGGRTQPWGSPVIIGLIALAVVASVLFVGWERRATHPVLPPRLFTNPTLRTVLLATLLLGAMLAGSIVYLPTFLQTAFDIGAAQAGLAGLPYFATFVVVSAVAGSRAGASGKFKPYLVAGASLSVVAFTLLSQLDLGVGYGVLAVHLAGLGLAFGLMVQNLVVVGQNAVPPADLGAATSATVSIRGLGMSLGVALFSSLLARELPAHPPATATAAAVPHVLLWGAPLGAALLLLVTLLPKPS